MARLIDADTLKESMIGACNIFEKHGIDTMIARAVISIIDAIAGVDAVPVRHGRWEFSGDDDLMCSACGERYFVPALMHSIYTGFVGCKLDRLAFCPNCGAKMDGEMEENEK